MSVEAPGVPEVAPSSPQLPLPTPARQGVLGRPEPSSRTHVSPVADEAAMGLTARPALGLAVLECSGGGLRWARVPPTSSALDAF